MQYFTEKLEKDTSSSARRKAVTIESNQSSLLPGIVCCTEGAEPATGSHHLYRRKLLGFHSASSEKVTPPRAAASRQDPTLRLRDVNASVCAVSPRAALSGVMTANTAG